MASVELCQCCLRENEEEVADLWCNDCSEAVCRNCGKAHRRFASAHDVTSLKDAPTCRKTIPKYCPSHDNKKFILFCIEHNKLICHECLSENHRKCNRTLEIEKAAGGIRDSTAINDLKVRMAELTSYLEKTQIENKKQLSKISTEKHKANDHIQEFLKCFKGHLSQIENNVNKNYDRIVKQNVENEAQLSTLKQTLRENTDWLCMLERSSSESNIFYALTHLNTIHITSANKIYEIKNDLVTVPLDVLPPEGTKCVDKLFQELSRESKLKTMTSGIPSSRDFKQSQMKVEKESQPLPPRYQEQISDINSTFGAFCFTKDGRLVVEELFLSKNQCALKYCLRIFDLQNSKSTEILVLDKFYMKYLYKGSMCMYDDTFVLLVSNNNKRQIMVIDIKLKKMCRTINLQRSEGLGDVKDILWIACSYAGEIYLLADSSNNGNGLWLCSIDFNGKILSEVNMPLTVADMAFDGWKLFFYTDSRVNDIHCISKEREWSTSKCYSSLDLKEDCSILHISGDEVLLFEKITKTVYKLDVRTHRRSILSQNDIEKNATHFNLSLNSKTFAMTMDSGKRIRIFPF